MALFNNLLGIYITDEQITLCNAPNRIISGPFCEIVRLDSHTQEGNNIYLCIDPFRFSVVADYLWCKAILKKYIRLILPKIHFRTEAYFCVSPISREMNLRAIIDLYKFHRIYLSMEPIAFLHGIHVKNGIVISIHKRLLEISVVENLTVLQYKRKNIDDYIYEFKYSMINQTIVELLKTIDVSKLSNINKAKYYLIGERDTIHYFKRLCTLNNIELEIYSNANEIIVRNIFTAPKLNYIP